MTQPVLSVVIPVFNKRDVWPETLAALTGQTLPAGRFEVIVVDDGSTDGTYQALAALRHSCPLQVLRQSNQGPATARNTGAAAASGAVLLFLDADIVAAPGLFAAHCAGHERYPRALVMGRVRSLPSAAMRPAYRIFGQVYDLGDQERTLPPRLGLTQNISITAADFAACGGFDASLRWGEDTEFVYRAGAGFVPQSPHRQDTESACRPDGCGLELRYCPQALAFHNHPLSLAELCAKARKDHRLLVTLFSRHPEILRDLDYLADKLPIAWGQDPASMVFRKAWRTALASRPARAALEAACETLERHRPSPALLAFSIWKLIGAYQWLGLREGLREYGWRPDSDA